MKENGGDPVALSGVTLEDSRAGFAVIGDVDPRKTTDARGLLLGHRTVGGRACFIYLVGLVRKQTVEDIRLAAVSFEGGEASWSVGHPDKQALMRYAAAGREMWRGRSIDGVVPAEYRTFPRAADRFELSVEGPYAQARHVQSGAVFAVRVGWEAVAKR